MTNRSSKVLIAGILSFCYSTPPAVAQTVPQAKRSQTKFSKADLELLKLCKKQWSQDASKPSIFGLRLSPQTADQLLKLRDRTRKGSDNHTSIAYALAIYGVQVRDNVRRLLFATDLDRNNAHGTDMNRLYYEEAGPAISAIFKLHPSAELIEDALDAPESDGGIEAGLVSLIQDMFAHSAQLFLRALEQSPARTSPRIKRAAEALGDDGVPGFRKTTASLRRIAKASKNIHSKIAKRLLNATLIKYKE